MKKTSLVAAGGVLTLLISAAGVFAQTKPNVIGTWIGYALIGDDGRADISVVLDKGEAGYTGKLSETSGMIPELPLREIVFKDGKLSFEFDLVLDQESMLIKFELTPENETLKGFWSDPQGNSGLIELALRK